MCVNCAVLILVQCDSHSDLIEEKLRSAFVWSVWHAVLEDGGDPPRTKFIKAVMIGHYRPGQSESQKLCKSLCCSRSSSYSTNTLALPLSCSSPCGPLLSIINYLPAYLHSQQRERPRTSFFETTTSSASTQEMQRSSPFNAAIPDLLSLHHNLFLGTFSSPRLHFSAPVY